MAKTERDQIIDHEYDGIREYDNPVPLWLTLVFIGSVIFAIGYVPYYHVMKAGPLPIEEYEAEMAAADAVKEQQRQEAAKVDVAALGSDTDAIAEGEQLYTTYCVACHDVGGKGKIGPNLTDDVWINGDGSLSAIIKVVTEGVQAKGMPTWEPVIGPDGVQKVSAYVASLRAN